MSLSDVLSIALAVAGAVAFLIVPVARKIFVETFLHPTKRSMIVREVDGDLHVVREDDPGQRTHVTHA